MTVMSIDASASAPGMHYGTPFPQVSLIEGDAAAERKPKRETERKS